MPRIEADDVIQATNIGHYIGQWVELKQEGRDLVGLCPLHGEKSPSLHVHVAERFFKCFGCQAGGDAIKFAQLHLNLGFAEALQHVADFSGINGGSRPVAVQRAAPPAEDGFPQPKHTATYTYTDAQGGYLYEVWRMEPGRAGRKKDFRQCYRDAATGEMVFKKWPIPMLYRLPAVTAADEVILVEGEKDVETVERLGYVGTTSPGGSGAEFTATMISDLAGKTVFLMPDADEPGEKRGKQLHGLLNSKAFVVIFRPKTGKDITDWVEAEGEESVRAAIEEARAQASRDRLRGLLDVSQILERSGLGIDQFCDINKQPRGIQTGFHGLDGMTLGMFPGDLVIVAGRPAMGKTALAINIAMNIAGNPDLPLPVSVFSLEMSSDQLLKRIVCGEAMVDNQKYRLGYLSEDEQRRISRHLCRVAAMPIRFDDHGGASAAYIRQQIEINKPKFVVIDYLGLMSSPKSENRTQQVSAITREMKLIAKEYKVPVMLVAQLNRSTETRPSGNNVPQLSDLRESGSIEQDADQVWFVYRPEYYKHDREDLRGVAEIIVAKQRNGPIGKTKVTWLGQFTKFVNPVEGSI